jgi:hypothetical protein
MDVSPYLLRPIRSLAQAEADLEASRARRQAGPEPENAPPRTRPDSLDPEAPPPDLSSRGPQIQYMYSLTSQSAHPEIAQQVRKPIVKPNT